MYLVRSKVAEGGRAACFLPPNIPCLACLLSPLLRLSAGRSAGQSSFLQEIIKSTPHRLGIKRRARRCRRVSRRASVALFARVLDPDFEPRRIAPFLVGVPVPSRVSLVVVGPLRVPLPAKTIE